MTIRDVLPTVKEDAITMRDIERLTGWTGRDVRSAIERERRDGIPICANSSGFWLGQTAQEVFDSAASMTRRGYNCIRTGNAMHRTAEKMRELEQEDSK